MVTPLACTSLHKNMNAFVLCFACTTRPLLQLLIPSWCCCCLYIPLFSVWCAAAPKQLNLLCVEDAVVVDRGWPASVCVLSNQAIFFIFPCQHLLGLCLCRLGPSEVAGAP